MKNSFVAGLCVVVALVGGLIGYKAAPSQGGLLGISVTASNALNQQRLVTLLNNLGSPLTGIVAGSGTQNNTTTNSTTTVTGSITVTGAAVGDLCLFGESTTTVNVWGNCLISAANTATYYLGAATSTVTTIATTTVYATAVPRATFIAPTGL